MLNLMKKFLGIFIVLMFVSGCAATKDISVRAYKQDKARVDQELYGNQGYLFGEASDVGDRKETRKIYVVEFTKEAPRPVSVEYDENYERIEPSDPSQLRTPRAESIPRKKSEKTVRKEVVYPEISLPSFDDEEYDPKDGIDSRETSTEFREYVVEKDDTLQKISKKFYNSFSKWPRIYEANKTVIKNPDRITPGITIRIPADR